MTERQIEERMGREVRKRGGMFLKFLSPGLAGVPDRIIITPGGRVVFVELKTIVGRLSRIQEWVVSEMRKRHADVRVVYGVEEAMTLVNELMPKENSE